MFIVEMDLNIHRSEIEQFLCDVRDYLNNTLTAAEYQNTTNILNENPSASLANENLLLRCRNLLEYFRTCSATDNNRNTIPKNLNEQITNAKQATESSPSRLLSKSNGNCPLILEDDEEISYLDMTSGGKQLNTISTAEYIDFTDSLPNDRTTEQLIISNGSNKGLVQNNVHENDNDDEEDDPRIYDTCNIPLSESDETLKKRGSFIECTTEMNSILDCPYAGLPAAHLSIQKSAKFGPLQRIIEKRLFFDQSKKYYCGIVGDWLLCYCDGPTSLKPSTSLYLKNNGVEVEHYGEGKRREICFQITTHDPNKKFIFQSITEVDAKEWIHAIEAAIRGDSIAEQSPKTVKNLRKLPTPPTQKKTLFLMDDINSNHNDCIYEEPSPLFNVQSSMDLLISKGSKEMHTSNDDSSLDDTKLEEMMKKFEYDVPKSPPQPLLLNSVESETAELLTETAISMSPQNRASISQCDFQTKVKDVHSKLSSQLSSSGPKKGAKKTTLTPNPQNPQTIASTPHTPQVSKEQKKTKRSLSLSPCQKNTSSTKSISNGEKSTRNWFLNRLNKTTSSTRSSTSSVVSPTKCKQSEKENLLNNLETGDNFESLDFSSNGSSPTTSSFKCGKVNMIINQFEASGQLATIFSAEAFPPSSGNNSTESGNIMKFNSSFCENDSNNYEPIMTGPLANNSIKKV